MAIYHLSVKPVQRSAGRSSVAAAAYRAGARLTDDRTGLIHDYTKKALVDHTELVGWDGSRQALWDSAEAAERRKDGTTAREYEIALPAELDHCQKIQLTRDYSQWLHDRHGVAVDVAIHGLETKNPHAHLLTTTRQSLGHELGPKVAREWSDSKRKKSGMGCRAVDLKEARQVWEQKANKSLEMAGHAYALDHRSLVVQGVVRAPTVHLGPIVSEIERRGGETRVGGINREVNEVNQALIMARQSWGEAKLVRDGEQRCISEFEEALKRARARERAWLIGEFKLSPELEKKQEKLKTAHEKLVEEWVTHSADWRKTLRDHLQTRRPRIFGRKAWTAKVERLETSLQKLEDQDEWLSQGRDKSRAAERAERAEYDKRKKVSDRAKSNLVVLDKVEQKREKDPGHTGKPFEEIMHLVQVDMLMMRIENENKARSKALEARSQSLAKSREEEKQRLEAQKQAEITKQLEQRRLEAQKQTEKAEELELKRQMEQERAQEPRGPSMGMDR